MKSFAQFTGEIRRDIWPSGEAENLVLQHDRHFQEALAKIQEMVDGQQSNNVNVLPFCKTQYKCGMTIVRAPYGIVRRVYVISNDNWCDPVFYRQVDWPGPECHGRQALGYVGQATSSGRKLGLGFSEADAGNDSKCGRARTGIWALHQGNIYISPWIQSVEAVVIEWDGVKEEWGQDDPVPGEIGFRSCVKLYAQFAHERDYGDPQKAMMFHNPSAMRSPNGREPVGHFDLALAELMWRDRDVRRTRGTSVCHPDMGTMFARPVLEEKGLTATAAPALVVAHVGLLEGGVSSVAAARAIFNLSSGVAIFGAGWLSDASASYDDTVGYGFHDLVKPYAGDFGDEAESNAFWPAPGKLDFDKETDLSSFKEFFANRTSDYYEVCLGEAHFFIVSSDSREPGGNGASSEQAEWLRIKLRLSTARWKVVVMSDNAWSSVRQNTGLRWSFGSWGAHLVLSSGAVNYERLESDDDVPFIVNGLACAGSVAAEPVTSALAQSVANYSGGPAIGVITASKTSLKYELLLADGSVGDTLTL